MYLWKHHILLMKFKKKVFKLSESWGEKVKQAISSMWPRDYLLCSESIVPVYNDFRGGVREPMSWMKRMYSQKVNHIQSTMMPWRDSRDQTCNLDLDMFIVNNFHVFFYRGLISRNRHKIPFLTFLTLKTFLPCLKLWGKHNSKHTCFSETERGSLILRALWLMLNGILFPFNIFGHFNFG